MEELLHVDKIRIGNGLLFLDLLFILIIIYLILHNLHNSFFVHEFLVESTTFSSPLFVCTDNVATMRAAFEGGFDTNSETIRSGYTEHRLSTCNTVSFSRSVILNWISSWINFYLLKHTTIHVRQRHYSCHFLYQQKSTNTWMALVLPMF